MMKIIWHGHSCFTLETAAGRVVCDPYADGSVPGLAPLRLEGERVVCSHGHRDHNGVETVALTGRKCGVEVGSIQTYHDPEGGALRGENRIHLFRWEGLRVAHLGDLGCTLEPGQLEQLKGLDALMVPVGGYYTIDARQAWQLVQELAPRVVLPMHYRSPSQGFGYEVLAPLDDFLALCPSWQAYPGNALELTRDTPPQTAVLAWTGG